MPFAENDGVELAYERVGTPTGPPVVFVEGLGYGRWMWRWQREALADAYDIVLWDNRGTGESDAPEGPYTMAGMAGDLAAVLDAAGLERAHVIGASMGGMIALQFALISERAASLTLLCTTPGGDAAEPVPEETQARMFDVPPEYDEREAIRYKMRPAMTETFWTQNQALIDDIVDERLASDATDRAREWQGAAVEAFDVHDRLGEIDCPSLVLHGRQDQVVPVENHRLLAEGLPDIEVTLFEEGGSHLFSIERAAAVSDRIRAFLSSS